MNEEFLLKITLTAETPLIINNNVSTEAYYESINYIPATTLAGAIQSALRENICPSPEERSCHNCNEKNDCEFENLIKGKLTITPGIPMGDAECLNHELYCNTPFSLIKCKKCGELIDIASQFIKKPSSQVEISCPNCKTSSTEKISGPFCKNCKKKVNVKKIFRINNSINRQTRSSEKEMLFYYEAIQDETIFKAEIFGHLENVKKKLLDLKSIHVGRGHSRGFGIVSLEMNEISLQDRINDNKRKIKKTIDEYGNVILINKTPAMSLKMEKDGLKTIPYLKEIPLKHSILKIDKTQGSTIEVVGWSLHTNSQKPRMRAAHPSSLFVYKADNDLSEEDIEKLASLTLKGIGQSFLIQNGFNQFTTWEKLL